MNEMSTPVGRLIDLTGMDCDANSRLSTTEQTDYNSINADEQAQEQEVYPHLSSERIGDFRSINATSDQIRKADQAAKKEIDGRLKKYSLGNAVEEQSGGPCMKVAVIGTSGSGKSATANTLLQETRFYESTSAISQATETREFTSQQSPPLTVIDTSGSWTLPKIAKGKDAIYVLVINLASPRFGREDLKRIRSMKDYNNIIKSKRCVVLLTHASDALQGKSLYEYVQEIKGDPLYELIMKGMEGWRVMAINNNCDTKYEADKQHKMITNVLQRTYGTADFSADNNRFWFISLAVLSFIVLFLVIFLSAWYTHGNSSGIMSTTLEPNITTERTPSMITTVMSSKTTLPTKGMSKRGTGGPIGDMTNETTTTPSDGTQTKAGVAEAVKGPRNKRAKAGG